MYIDEAIAIYLVFNNKPDKLTIEERDAVEHAQRVIAKEATKAIEIYLRESKDAEVRK